MCLPLCLQQLAQSLPSSPLPRGPTDPNPQPALPVRGATPRVVDLTHPLDEAFPTFSGRSQISTRQVSTLAANGWNVREWTLDEHTGTHLDAPWHKADAGICVDQILPHNLVGPLVVVDIQARAAQDPDATVTVSDLELWESRHGPIPTGSVVAMRSGWSLHARSARFRNSDSIGQLHFPGFGDEAAGFLATQRSVVGIAVDTLSLDCGRSQDFPVHRRWLGSGRWGLECVANLDQLPPVGATLVVGVPRVVGASGAPCRLLALV